jgi:hypothetical protein
MTPRPVGGFFELEPGVTSGCFHPEAFPLCSGRAALGHILDELQPDSVWAPFYICDSALSPIVHRQIPIKFYALSASFEPLLDVALASRDCVLYVNYFGLHTHVARALAESRPHRTVIDDTQAFFCRGHAGAYSFNSARKFFGVPDGAYAYGTTGKHSDSYERVTEVRYQHLVSRLLGFQREGYEQYLESERRVCSAPRGMSVLAEQVLASIDYERARSVRRRNFWAVHECLGAHNQLASCCSLMDADDVPFCYPFLPERPVDRRRLWTNGVFVSVLWPEIETRRPAGFTHERRLAAQLLPLPIDQRYGVDEMELVCRHVMAVLN